MFRLHTKIGALSSLKPLKSSSSSTPPYQLLSKKVHRTCSACNEVTSRTLSSSFSPKSTSPRSNHQTALPKPSSTTTHSIKFDVNQPKPNSNDTIQSDSGPPISFYIDSLSAHVKNKNYPEAVHCYKRFASSGLPSNFFILNILLNSYCNMKLATGGGFSVFGVILKIGFSPNTITFTSLIKGLCLEERIGEASGLFRKMSQLGFCPNVVTCTTLISGLCKAGNSNAALDLHRQMLKGEIGIGPSCKPTLMSYGTLIDGVCKAGLLVKARELLIEMRSNGISPNVVVYTSLLDRLCWSGMWEEARLVYQEMMDDGVQANAMTFEVILKSLSKQGKVNKANELITQGGDPSEILQKILIEAGGK